MINVEGTESGTTNHTTIHVVVGAHRRSRLPPLSVFNKHPRSKLLLLNFFFASQNPVFVTGCLLSLRQHLDQICAKKTISCA
ncbi:hypothetical protein ES332_A07G221000v1 [Gossypium tomentosum]|uniref:Uncharacterized protein n=1 Tax=Gossypium tomentosum TaxID=34277 RepID=A0A5D2PVW4_GOSTO|nr:hypothetical protein ES332_A07G221000v1 [Gossypium tomentosum]